MSYEVICFMSAFAFLVSLLAVAGGLYMFLAMRRLGPVRESEEESESVLFQASEAALCPKSSESGVAIGAKPKCRLKDGSCGWHDERGVKVECTKQVALTESGGWIVSADKSEIVYVSRTTKVR